MDLQAIFQELFKQFSDNGRLVLPDMEQGFGDNSWVGHSVFEGVALKQLIGGEQTGGQFSFHLVKIAPNKKIGNHVHQQQLETHEVIAGNGVCINNGVELQYAPGVISFMPPNVPHEVCAGEQGLYLFAKFIPALS